MPSPNQVVKVYVRLFEISRNSTSLSNLQTVAAEVCTGQWTYRQPSTSGQAILFRSIDTVETILQSLDPRDIEIARHDLRTRLDVLMKSWEFEERRKNGMEVLDLSQKKMRSRYTMIGIFGRCHFSSQSRVSFCSSDQ